MDDELPDVDPDESERSRDPQTAFARREIVKIIDENPDDVFYSRQLEILLEGDFFDWITNRALHELIDDHEIEHEKRSGKFNHDILLVWNKTNRYYKRRAARVVSLVDDYSEPEFTDLLGAQGQLLFENAMGRLGYRFLGENVNEWNGKKWTTSNENLDYMYEKDGIVYGVEVKNALGKMKDAEVKSKSAMSTYLGIVPFFVVRWMPRTWISRVVKGDNGFVLMLHWQLYPLSHAKFAKTIREELRLPVDAPPRYHQKTLDRITENHEKRVNSLRDSQ